jgi:hypothetical protein
MLDAIWSRYRQQQRDRGRLQNKDTNSIFTWQITWEDIIESLLFYIRLKIGNYNNLQFTVCTWYAPCKQSRSGGQLEERVQNIICSQCKYKTNFSISFQVSWDTRNRNTVCVDFFRHVHICLSENTGKEGCIFLDTLTSDVRGGTT